MSHIALPPQENRSTESMREHSEFQMGVDENSAAFKLAVKEGVEKALQDRKATEAILGSTATSLMSGDYLYVAKVKLMGTTMSAFCFFTHSDKFSETDFQNKVIEACKVTVTSRLASRRKQMADNKVPVRDSKGMNERLFPSDVDFMETVMSDKWRFKSLKITAAVAEIEGTIQHK